MSGDNVAIARGTYDAFNRGDVPAVLGVMADDVEWLEAETRLVLASTLDELSTCDLVIEAAPERLDLKRELLERLSELCGPETVLATNTSSILVSSLASAAARPENVVGMHFMNPVPLMKLVEIVRGLPTSEATYQATVALAKRFGKTTIGARDIPGFIVNRMLIPLLNEAIPNQKLAHA